MCMVKVDDDLIRLASDLRVIGEDCTEEALTKAFEEMLSEKINAKIKDKPYLGILKYRGKDIFWDGYAEEIMGKR